MLLHIHGRGGEHFVSTGDKADAADPEREEQLEVTAEVLHSLECDDIPQLTVYNKCDKPGSVTFDPNILLTSAKTGYGLDALLAKLDELLSDRVQRVYLENGAPSERYKQEN